MKKLYSIKARVRPRLSRYPEIILQSAEVGVTKSDSKTVAYENRTESAKSEGLERNGPRERISGSDRVSAVLRFVREGPPLLAILARLECRGEGSSR
jgi:hypothetical protein